MDAAPQPSREPIKRGLRARFQAIAICFAVIFVSAYASIWATRGEYALAPFWPANAIALVLLMRAPNGLRLRADIVAAAAIASILANWLGGSDFALALWFTAANGVEIFFARYLIQRAAHRSEALPDGGTILRQFRYLMQTALLAPALGAVVAAIGLNVFKDIPLHAAWVDWYFTAALGMLIIAPIGMRVHVEDWRQLRSVRGLLNAAFCFLLTAAAAALVFSSQKWPLPFLLTPVVLLSAYKLRSLGAGGATLIIAVIAVPLAVRNTGLLSILPDLGLHDRQFLLQIYLVTQSLIGLSAAAILDDRDGLQRALEAREKTSRDRADMQSRVLTSVAHEIRTPLNVIQGFGEILHTEENLSDRGRSLMRTMIGAAGELQSLANDLLDRSRIESGALRLAPESILATALLDDIKRELPDHSGARAFAVEFFAPPGLSIWADPMRLKQIVRNLVLNAVNYAGAYGRISVHARALQEPSAAARVRIEVIDQGPGIPRIRQHEVFEPFSRIGPDTTSKTSAGFGLSVVKALAEAQGGAVGFSSAPYIETRFWVDMPGVEPPNGALGVRGFDDSDFDPDSVFPP